MRRRNMRLSKILQPKNAIMILNELARGCTYLVEELPVKVDSNQYRATVAFDGMEFAGTGKKIYFICMVLPHGVSRATLTHSFLERYTCGKAIS